MGTAGYSYVQRHELVASLTAGLAMFALSWAVDTHTAAESAALDGNQWISKEGGAYSPYPGAQGGRHGLQLKSRQGQCVEENQEGGLLLVACDPDKEAQQWIYDSSQGEIREAKHAEHCLEAQISTRTVALKPCDYTHYQSWGYDSQAGPEEPEGAHDLELRVSTN